LALSGLQTGVKEKKFKSSIKQAGKILANNLYTKPEKEKKKKVKEPNSNGVTELTGA